MNKKRASSQFAKYLIIALAATFGLSQTAFAGKARKTNKDKNELAFDVEAVSIDAKDPDATRINYRVTRGSIDSAKFYGPSGAPQTAGSSSGWFYFSFNQKTLARNATTVITMRATKGDKSLDVVCTATRTSYDATATDMILVITDAGPTLFPTHHLVETYDKTVYSGASVIAGSKTKWVGNSNASLTFINTHGAVADSIEFIGTATAWNENHWYESPSGTKILSKAMSDGDYAAPRISDPEKHYYWKVSSDTSSFLPGAQLSGQANNLGFALTGEATWHLFGGVPLSANLP